MTKRNTREAGLYYKHIQDAYLENKDFSNIGISKIEPRRFPLDFFEKSSWKTCGE